MTTFVQKCVITVQMGYRCEKVGPKLRFAPIFWDPQTGQLTRECRDLGDTSGPAVLEKYVYCTESVIGKVGLVL